MKVQPFNEMQEAVEKDIYGEIEGDFNAVREKVSVIIEEYNTEFPSKEINLVLFDDFLDHLVKLIRVLKFPRGHSMMVGFGGSGKQSLTKLASIILSLNVTGIKLKRNYKESNFLEDISNIYEELKTKESIFLFTDA
jgi:dynein heavy chain, axonemal